MFLLLCLQCSTVLTNEWTQIRLKDSNSQCTSELPTTKESCDRQAADFSDSYFGQGFPAIIRASPNKTAENIQVCLITVRVMGQT